jgi:hypothetical protein
LAIFTRILKSHPISLPLICAGVGVCVGMVMGTGIRFGTDIGTGTAKDSVQGMGNGTASIGIANQAG